MRSGDGPGPCGLYNMALYPPLDFDVSLDGVPATTPTAPALGEPTLFPAPPLLSPPPKGMPPPVRRPSPTRSSAIPSPRTSRMPPPVLSSYDSDTLMQPADSNPSPAPAKLRRPPPKVSKASPSKRRPPPAQPIAASPYEQTASGTQEEQCMLCAAVQVGHHYRCCVSYSVRSFYPRRQTVV